MTAVPSDEPRFGLDALPFAACLLDAGGGILAYNDSLRRFLGSPRRIRGRELASLLPEGLCEELEAARTRARRMRKTSQVAGIRVRHDGSGWWSVNVSPVPDAPRESYLCVVLHAAQRFDASRREGEPVGPLPETEVALRRSRGELEQPTRTLEDRVVERTAELERRVGRLRHLPAMLVRAAQREREQLAAVLHGGLQQQLVAAKMQVSLARRSKGEAVQATLARAHELLTRALDESRSFAVELSPPVLHGPGLAAALRWLAGRLRQTHNLNIQVVAGDEAEPPTDDLRLLLFQAARELLLNVVEHAGVDEAVVSLQREDEHLHLVVTDRGKGFGSQQLCDWESVAAGSGLLNIEQRLECLGGSVEIASTPGQGTQVRLVTPATHRNRRVRQAARPSS